MHRTKCESSSSESETWWLYRTEKQLRNNLIPIQCTNTTRMHLHFISKQMRIEKRIKNSNLFPHPLLLSTLNETIGINRGRDFEFVTINERLRQNRVQFIESFRTIGRNIKRPKPKFSRINLQTSQISLQNFSAINDWLSPEETF